MHSIRDLRRRIRSVGSTAQITKAMQMVAASKMRKAQQVRAGWAPLCAPVVSDPAGSDDPHGRFQSSVAGNASDVRKRAVILIAADKGLCGALNSNLFRVASRV